MSDILIERNDGVVVLSINRPEQRNSMTTRTAQEVQRALLDISRDNSVRVLVLRGVGHDFCCGADIGRATQMDSGGTAKEVDTSIYETSLLLHEMPAVTIAAVRGGCAGAGFGWATACDLRIASPSARFNTAFLNVGVAGDMAGPWLLPRIIGSGRARELYMIPRKFDADEALAMGFVNRVFSEETFENELAALIDNMQAAAPLALRTIKANFVDAERMPLNSYIAMESDRHERLYASADRAEAFRAYVEKRRGNFIGA